MRNTLERMMLEDDLTLYHIGFSRSTSVLWMLEELGQPYKVCPVDRDRDKRDPSFIKTNPLNKVPALKHGGKIVTEAAAICLYLAEVFPEAKLEVKPGGRNRAEYLKWSFLGPTCIEPAILDRMYEREEIPVGSSGWGDFEQLIQHISGELDGNKYILGEQFCAADVILASQLNWGMMIDKLPATSVIEDYIERINNRPARKRVFEMEETKSWPM